MTVDIIANSMIFKPGAEIGMISPPATMSGMNRPRLQFSLRGMLVATFWAAISVAAWTVDIRPVNIGPGLLLYFLCYFLRFLGPPTAIGSLFDETPIGLLLGVAFVAIFVILMIWHLAVTGAPPVG